MQGLTSQSLTLFRLVPNYLSIEQRLAIPDDNYVSGLLPKVLVSQICWLGILFFLKWKHGGTELYPAKENNTK